MARIRPFLYGAGNFLLPVAILTATALACGYHPFGPMMFIASDMRTQYIDFFAWYQDVLQGNADPFYTTTAALGNATASTFGYYLASPFNALLAVFDQDMAAFCLFAVILKAGFIQVATAWYVRRRFDMSRVWASALALGFTLSVWTITQMRNIMWLDGLIFLPLCAGGACCLLKDGRWRLLAVAFGAAVLTNWYMGFMIGLFLCLYIFFEAYALGFEGTKLTGRLHQRRIFQFFGAMALGLALAAVVFLPSIFGIVDGGAASTGNDSGLSAIHGKLANRIPFLAAVPMEAILAAAALAAFAVAAAVFCIMRGKSLRRKLAVLLLIALVGCLAAGVAVPPLMYAEPPDIPGALLYGNWVYDRTPQLFDSFLVLALAVWFFCSQRTALKLKLSAGLFLFLLLLSAWLIPLQFIWGGFRFPAGHYSRMAFLFGFMLLWCAGCGLRALLTCPDANKALTLIRSRGASWALLALTALEVLLRASWLLPAQFDYYPQSAIDGYVSSAVQQVAELEERDPGIYRVDKVYWRFGECALNEGMSLGTHQISSYTSTGDGSVLSFLDAIGCGDTAYLTFDCYPSLVGDSLLGVKYLSAEEAPNGYVDARFTAVEVPDGAKFYENPYALSLAYGASSDITGFQMPEGTRWECLNAFASAIAGYEVTPYPDTAELDDQAAEQTLDLPVFQQMISLLKQHEFTFDEFGGSRISGTVDAAEGQVLLMTIPNQRGWTVSVNGEQVQPQDVAGGALMAIPVQAGENRVEMQFITPGLRAGAALSVLALLFVMTAPRIRRAQKG